MTSDPAPVPDPAHRSPRRGSRWLIAAAALVACLGTARLGVWQLDRAAQKTAMQEAVDARARLPVLDGAVLLHEPLDAERLLQRHIRVRGRWLPQATVFLDNRPMDGRAGFIVVTPLLLTDRTALAVARGWVPRDFVDRARVPQIASATGEVELNGRLAPWPSALYDFGADQDGRIRQNLDRAAYSAQIGVQVLPLSLQLLPGATGDQADLQRNWPPPALNVERNHGYAVQWFALSALVAGLYLWFQVLRPWRAARRCPHHDPT